jgi:hypothetical protein
MGYNETPYERTIMPPKAVLITEDTYPLILRKMGLTPQETEKQLRSKPKVDYINRNFYFVANYLKEVSPNAAWVIVEEGFLQQNFTFDADRIKIQFVEITRK